MTQSSGLMQGKRGMLLAVANNRSIAWGEAHQVDSGYRAPGTKRPDAPDISLKGIAAVAMPVPVIYYIRHGETAWNAAGRFQGSQDIPLNELGRTQAVASGEILKRLLTSDGHAPQSLPYVASPLGRARTTMELLRGVMALPAEDYSIDDRLREIGYGSWEGLTLPEMEANDPATFTMRQLDKWSVAAPSGESYASVTARMRQWSTSLAGDTVTVAHGGTMRALMVALGVAPPLAAADTPIGQGVVYVFRDGQLTKYS